MKKALFAALLTTGFLAVAPAQALTVSSSLASVGDVGRFVLNGFGCTGGNMSPLVEWRDPPTGTQSFAVTIFDPDAPTGHGWWHWTVFDIPPSVFRLEENASATQKLPAASIEGRTDFGTSGYGGPCPPKGDKPHRYIVMVYALKMAKLGLSPESQGATVGDALTQNALATASVTATYGR